MEELKFNENGLIPASIQDDETDQVLLLGYMNKKAVEKTLDGPDV
jgi:phosphoribosyl-ATP pyrophosphohydrolase/phosphoribosyl-AMP cyclohydrolase